MPYGVLLIKSAELLGAANYAAGQLPEIVAPALSLEGRKLHDGKIGPNEVMIIPVLCSNAVNGKDLELIVIAHDFPERRANIEERETLIHDGLRSLLCRNVFDVTVGVCLILTSMAYGEFRID